jgi:hypothetical protein
MGSSMSVRVVCPGCGPVVVPANELRCELEAAGERGICELRCPLCTATVLVPAVASSVKTMHGAGAGHMSIAPFELLEAHVGPPISWDDVLDFSLALDGTQLFLSAGEEPQS